MTETNHTRSRYDLIAPVYDLVSVMVEKFRYQRWRSRLWERVAGSRVLEIGIGTGKNLPYYPETVDITAIDLSEKMIAQAKHAIRRIGKAPKELIQMDAQHLKFPDDHFDSVVATFVFCSVPNPILGLREALRVTKPGGRLLLIEHMLSDWPVYSWMMKKLDGYVHWLLGYHIARRTVENVREAGWKIDQVTSLDMTNNHRMVLASKE